MYAYISTYMHHDSHHNHNPRKGGLAFSSSERARTNRGRNRFPRAKQRETPRTNLMPQVTALRKTHGFFCSSTHL